MKPYRCDHGLKMNPLGEYCKNNWCQLKHFIRKDYADLSELSFFERLRARIYGSNSEITKSWQLNTNFLSQTFVVLNYKGKTYFKRWGKL